METINKFKIAGLVFEKSSICLFQTFGSISVYFLVSHNGTVLLYNVTIT